MTRTETTLCSRWGGGEGGRSATWWWRRWATASGRGGARGGRRRCFWRGAFRATTMGSKGDGVERWASAAWFRRRRGCKALGAAVARRDDERRLGDEAWGGWQG